MSFDQVIYIYRDINKGWILRYLHANGASIFFICLYLHIGRGLYYGSIYLFHTWIVGVTLLLITIATAFLGYVLPWGQISLWGASVITNLLTTVPYIGPSLVQWLWGGFSVATPTLTRFFTLHFLLPFSIIALTIVHLTYLHQTGSNNPLGLKNNLLKVYLHPLFVWKDILGIIIVASALILLTFIAPLVLGDPENFIPANPLNSPLHIQPEWYYLFAYAILRSIPHKLRGVIALASSILILYILPYTHKKHFKPLQFYPLNQLLFYIFIRDILLLTWVGANPVEEPYILIGQIATILYFLYFIVDHLLSTLWNFLLHKNLEQIKWFKPSYPTF